MKKILALVITALISFTAIAADKPAAEKPIGKPLRVPIQDVYTITGVGTVPVGRVETGIMKTNQKIIVMPSGALGEIKSIEVPQRIRQWWFTSDTGKVCIQVKYGSRTIDISKGKNSVEVSSANELLKALETLKLAAESGEFDVQLESAGLKLKNGFTK